MDDLAKLASFLPMFAPKVQLDAYLTFSWIFSFTKAKY